MNVMFKLTQQEKSALPSFTPALLCVLFWKLECQITGVLGYILDE